MIISPKSRNAVGKHARPPPALKLRYAFLGRVGGLTLTATSLFAQTLALPRSIGAKFPLITERLRAEISFLESPRGLIRGESPRALRPCTSIVFTNGAVFCRTRYLSPLILGLSRIIWSTYPNGVSKLRMPFRLLGIPSIRIIRTQVPTAPTAVISARRKIPDASNESPHGFALEAGGRSFGFP